MATLKLKKLPDPEKIKAKKLKDALIGRLKLHKKWTEMLKALTHPSRIMQIERSITRINTRLRTYHNVISIKYENGEQVVTWNTQTQ